MNAKTILIIFLFFISSLITNAQKPAADINVLMMRGEKYKEGVMLNVTCVDSCLIVDKDGNYIVFTLTGTLNDRTVKISGEVPVLKGTKKIKVDSDGDLPAHQKFSIEIYGSNPAVDKDSYEIQDESDEAVVNIMRFDEEKGEVEGTFSVKYIDSATAIRRLSATSHFIISLNR